MAVDEELLERSNTENDVEEETDESETAGDLRAARRGYIQSSGDRNMSVRESKQQDVIDKKIAAAKAQATQSKPSTNPFRRATDKLLMGAWESLIPSWGLTLIWIDIHAFLNKALGPWAFCDLGEEWVPAEARKSLASSSATEKSVALLKKVEEMGCGCLNLGCLFIILFILILIALIGAALANPLQALWDLTRFSLSSFFDLF